MSVQELNALVNRLEAVASRLEGACPPSQASTAAPPPAASDAGSSASVQAFDALLQGALAQYVSLSQQIGGDVASQAAEVQEAFNLQRAFLVTAASSKQPSQENLGKLLAPLSAKIQAVQSVADKSRDANQRNHLKALQESIAALGWVAVSPLPGPHVKDMMESGDFWAIRVQKDFKEEPHKSWCAAWKSIWVDLQAYIKTHHTTGVTWNPKGGDASAASSAAAPAPPAGGPPPPPPPPPPSDEYMNQGLEDSAGKAALFADLNRGGDVTSGLKKVTDDMKTHKNPALRSGPAPFKKSTDKKPPVTPKPGPKPSAPVKPPKIELQGKRWMVEYQKDNNNIELNDTELKHTVYVFKCERSTVQIKGKVNSIILDNCKRVAIVFHDVISGLEFVNCQSVKGQAMGRCPTVSIDKTDGCMVYLSKESVEAEIVTAKSSEMNILYPKDDGEFSEHPVPEQFKSKFNSSKGTLETTITDIAA